MSDDKLVIVGQRGAWGIAWNVRGTTGAALGWLSSDGAGRSPGRSDVDLYEHWAVCRAVRKAPGMRWRDDGLGFRWGTKRGATVALKAAREALKRARENEQV